MTKIKMKVPVMPDYPAVYNSDIRTSKKKTGFGFLLLIAVMAFILVISIMQFLLFYKNLDFAYNITRICWEKGNVFPDCYTDMTLGNADYGLSVIYRQAVKQMFLSFLIMIFVSLALIFISVILYLKLREYSIAENFINLGILEKR